LEKLLDTSGLAWSVPQDRDHSVETRLAVEATPGQIKAILAGLKARPDVFLSVAVNPVPSNLPPEIAQSLAVDGKALRGRAFEYTQRPRVSGPQAGPGAAGKLDMLVRESSQPQSQLPSKSNVPRSVAPLEREEKRQTGQVALRWRVLFVLQAAGGVEAESDAAKPAASAATLPAKEK
jgi:hypothetical protein